MHLKGILFMPRHQHCMIKHAPVHIRLVPIMLFKLPIMLWSNTPEFYPLCSNYAP